VKADVVTPAAEPGQIPPRLDWGYFDDNYFSLLAGESRCIRMTLATWAPTNPLVRVEAWNADAMDLPVTRPAAERDTEASSFRQLPEYVGQNTAVTVIGQFDRCVNTGAHTELLLAAVRRGRNDR